MQTGKLNEKCFAEVQSPDDLAQFWFRFDFDKDFMVLGQMVDRFGANAVLRATDFTGKTLSHWIASRGKWK